MGRHWKWGEAELSWPLHNGPSYRAFDNCIDWGTNLCVHTKQGKTRAPRLKPGAGGIITCLWVGTRLSIHEAGVRIKSKLTTLGHWLYAELSMTRTAGLWNILLSNSELHSPRDLARGPTGGFGQIKNYTEKSPRPGERILMEKYDVTWAHMEEWYNVWKNWFHEHWSTVRPPLLLQIGKYMSKGEVISKDYEYNLNGYV